MINIALFAMPAGGGRCTPHGMSIGAIMAGPKRGADRLSAGQSMTVNEDCIAIVTPLGAPFSIIWPDGRADVFPPEPVMMLLPAGSAVACSAS